MPTIATPPPPAPAAAVRSQLLTEECSRGEGAEALRLFDLLDEALSHLAEPAGTFIGPSAEDEDDFDYHLPFPAPRLTAKVRYKFVGKLKPSPIDLDE